MQAGRLTEAIQQLRHAVQIGPSAYTHNNLGFAIMHSGKLPQAIGHYRAAIRLNPDFVHAYANLAQVLKLSNRSQEAIATAEKGIEIARSTGDDTLSGQLVEWLTQLQAKLRRQNDAQSSRSRLRLRPNLKSRWQDSLKLPKLSKRNSPN